jgi:hypothetical protein
MGKCTFRKAGAAFLKGRLQLHMHLKKSARQIVNLRTIRHKFVGWQIANDCDFVNEFCNFMI